MQNLVNCEYSGIAFRMLYSFQVIYAWNLSSFFETVCFLTRSVVLMSIWKVLRPFTGLITYKQVSHKRQIFLRGIKLWNFIFDKGLFQLSEEKSCFFSTSVWQDTKKCMLHAHSKQLFAGHLYDACAKTSAIFLIKIMMSAPGSEIRKAF